MNLLDLTRITKSFDGLSVLRELTLSFQAGSVTAILGDNGAGKSTLLRIIAGVYPPDGGEIKLADRVISSLSVRERRELGIEMVYQDLALVKHQDVVHNLFLGREMRSSLGFLKSAQMQSIAKERLEALGVRIPDLTRPAGKLSGGQQQSVAIARALLFSPKVLLLDEPTAALGAREVGQVLKLIRLARDEGKAIIFVSHRFNDVFEVADRIVILKQGSVFSDEPAEKSSIPDVVAKIVS